MRDAGQEDIRTVTLLFDEFRGTSADEAPLAERVAKACGTRHTTRRVGPKEFRSDLPRIVEAMDQPSVDGINTWFVSKAARELGLKVAVSGVGGDELLGGYDSFWRVPAVVNWLRSLAGYRGLERALTRAAGCARALGVPVHPKVAGLLTYGTTYAGAYFLQRGLYLPSEVGDAMADSAFVREGLATLEPLCHIERELHPGPRSAFGKVATLESSLYLRNQLLRDADWAGMAHSLEVRTPLVDHELLRRVAPLMVRSKRGGGKGLLANAPTCRVPKEIRNRRKSGFGIPIATWHCAAPTAGSPRACARVDSRLWSRAWALEVATMCRRDALTRGGGAPTHV
jgi:asparagine synthase (glutamine-hydrolysing)